MSADAADATWTAGAVIGGRYRLVKLIGAGAMAEVWQAEHVTLQTPVAVKLVSVAQDARADETLERFLREAQAAAKLRSPHVVQILDHGMEGHSAYLTMELLEGESLRQLMLREPTLEPLEMARIVSQLARGLELAHASGIVHRDLKPENIFLAKDQGRAVVKILDFGIAKRIDLQGVDRLATQDGFMVGTPCYMSPEQVLGTGKIDARSDLWQVAVVTFECLCGRRPFDAPAVGELMMSICSGPLPVPSQMAPVPLGFDAWFARAVHRAADGRFQSATEMADALVAVLAPHTTAAALAESLPAWVPPALGSNPGAFDQSYSGIFDSSQSFNRLGTTSRQTWASHRLGGRGLSPRRALLTALLVAVPVAALATVGGLWFWSGGTPAASGSGAAADAAVPTHAPPAKPTATPSLHAGPGGVSSGAASGSVPSASPADAGAGSAASGTPSRKPRHGPVAPPPQPPPRGQRPEDVLGI